MALQRVIQLYQGRGNCQTIAGLRQISPNALFSSLSGNYWSQAQMCIYRESCNFWTSRTEGLRVIFIFRVLELSYQFLGGLCHFRCAATGDAPEQLLSLSAGCKLEFGADEPINRTLQYLYFRFIFCRLEKQREHADSSRDSRGDFTPAGPGRAQAASVFPLLPNSGSKGNGERAGQKAPCFFPPTAPATVGGTLYTPIGCFLGCVAS